MKVSQIVPKHFPTKSALADALGVRPQAVQSWHAEIPARYLPALVLLLDGKVVPEDAVLREWLRVQMALALKTVQSRVRALA